MSKSKLFDLIKSMSMSEKRYFKIYSTRHIIGEENNYIKIFDLLDKQKTYDDEALNKAKFINNMAAEKHNLYQLILKSLSAYDAHSSDRVKIYDILHHVEILFQKGLYDQCESMLQKAEKIAKSKELIPQLLAVSELKYQLLTQNLQYNEALKTIATDEQAFAQLSNLNAVRKIMFEIYDQRVATGVTRSANKIKALKKYADDPLIKNPKKALTSRARLHQEYTLLTYYHAQKQSGKELKYIQNIVELFESHPFMIDASPMGYITALYNLSNTLQALGKYDEAFDAIDRLQGQANNKQLKNAPVVQARIFFFSNNLKLFLFLKLRKFDKALQLYTSIEKDIEKHEHFINRPILYDMYQLMTVTFIVHAEFKRALQLTNIIINDLEFKVREDILAITRLLNLLIHFELNNEFTGDYLAVSTYNYLRRRKYLFKVESTILSFIKKYYKKDSKEEIRNLLLETKDQLIELSKDPYEKRAFEHFNFIAWIDARLNNKQLKSVYKMI